MCTLIALWQSTPVAPLVMALNRDEFRDRPAEPMHIWEPTDDGPSILAGRDLRSRGSWFAIGRNVVAALTNHRSEGPSKPGIRSRGELVVAMAQSGSMAEAANWIGQQDPAEFGLFDMLVCDRKQLNCVMNWRGKMEIELVEPGLHILGNYGLDNPADPIVANLTRELGDENNRNENFRAKNLKAILERCGLGWPHMQGEKYGTRSSAILFWNETDSKLFESPEPPRADSWLDRTGLFAELSAI